MVGSGRDGGGGDRSKGAVGMMALHEALRSVCLNSDWTYSVFWTIRPRPRLRGGIGCKVGDDNGSLMLMWEDGYCRGRVGDCLEHIQGEDSVRKAFSKMSIQLYNYGEGLMGKVASDKCHKWVFKEPTESEINLSNCWQSSFDSLPPEWTDQFDSGIQTIAVIQAGQGLLQLGSCKIIPEDLQFVLRMRHVFESLGYQSGFYVSHLFSSTQTTPFVPSSSASTKQFTFPNQQALPPFFHWSAQPTNFHNSASCLGGFPQEGDDAPVDLNNMVGENEEDIKWHNGLSLFNAGMGHEGEPRRILFNPHSDHPVDHFEEKDFDFNPNPYPNPNEILSMDTNHHLKTERKFRRSYTMPTRMDTSSSSTPLDHHQPSEFRSSDWNVL